MAGFRTEIVVQLTEGGEAQVLGPYMAEPRTLKPGEQLRFRVVLDFDEPQEGTAADWPVEGVDE